MYLRGVRFWTFAASLSVLQESFVVFLGALLGAWISYSHWSLFSGGVYPQRAGICGEGCGKRGRGRGGGLGTLVREEGLFPAVCLLEKKLICGLGRWYFIPVYVVGQAKRRTGGNR